MSEQLWDRQPEESAKAYRAFTVYRDQGPQRSIRGTARAMARSATLLKDWSSRWGWVARCTAWDAQQRAIATAGYEAGVRAEAERWAERQNVQRDSEWEMARALMSKAGAMLRFPLATATQTEDDEGRVVTIVQPSKWALRDAAVMVDVAARLARLSANMAVPGGASLPAQEQVISDADYIADVLARLDEAGALAADPPADEPVRAEQAAPGTDNGATGARD